MFLYTCHDSIHRFPFLDQKIKLKKEKIVKEHIWQPFDLILLDSIMLNLRL